MRATTEALGPETPLMQSEQDPNTNDSDLIRRLDASRLRLYTWSEAVNAMAGRAALYDQGSCEEENFLDGSDDDLGVVQVGKNTVEQIESGDCSS